jgi:hypothetical protein
MAQNDAHQFQRTRIIIDHEHGDGDWLFQTQITWQCGLEAADPEILATAGAQRA